KKMRLDRPLHRSLLFAFVALVALASAATWANSRARHHAMASHPRASSPASAKVVATPSVAPVTVARAAIPSAKNNPTEAGMRAYLDPETGTIGPPANPQSAIAGTQDDGPTLHEVVLPDGSVMVDLQGTLQDYLIVNVDPKGHRIMR